MGALDDALPHQLEKENEMMNTRTDGLGHYHEIKRLVDILEWAERTDRIDLADSIIDRMREMALQVQVRDDWRHPGFPVQDKAVEFVILLGTGGPAVRLTGKLPCRWLTGDGLPTVELQNQDWGTPWERVPFATDMHYLARFAEQFYLED